MLKARFKVLASVLSLTIVISLFAGIPLKAQSEHALTNSKNTPPSIITPMIVNLEYPQMEKPVVEAHSNGDGTGYLDVSWEPVEGVEKYQIILFNGTRHSYWDVSASETSWTTRGKGMFPTASQIEEGQIDFLRNGTGTEFSSNPSDLYKKANLVNGGMDYSLSSDYYVRLTGVYKDGATPISDAIIVPITQDLQEMEYNEEVAEAEGLSDLKELSEFYKEDLSLVNISNFEMQNPSFFEDSTFVDTESTIVTESNINQSTRFVPVVYTALRILISKVGTSAAKRAWKIATPHVTKALKSANTYILEGPKAGRIIQVRSRSTKQPIFRLDYHTIDGKGPYLHYHVAPNIKKHYFF